jgi:phosphotransferase system enzyme I (PtsP)
MMPTRGALGGPRLLPRRLRELMAEPVNAQARLDRIVVQVASNMVAEVCSVYVLRADQRLELFATEGLKREAVHITTMRVDEGLVGLIAKTAEPLALTEAQAHPSFSYRPETGEEIYHSFLGVPILRGGNTLGVLVVQNRVKRAYSEEEVEVLETIAMLLAEMIASGELQSIVRPGADINLRRHVALKGSPINDGVGLGHAVMHEPRIVVTQIVAEDTTKELERLDASLQAMRANIDELLDNPQLRASGLLREREHPTEGRYVEVGMPVRFSAHQPAPPSHAVGPGEHSESVARELGVVPAPRKKPG